MLAYFRLPTMVLTHRIFIYKIRSISDLSLWTLMTMTDKRLGIENRKTSVSWLNSAIVVKFPNDKSTEILCGALIST